MLTPASKHDLSDLNGRIMFMQHNFFEHQPISGAAAYLLRYVTHNWSDEDCVRIFKAIVPALERSPPGTPLLINDTILPQLGETTRYHELRQRQLDIMMMAALGAKQRTESRFRDLLTSADARFKIKAIHGGGNISLIEAYLDMVVKNANGTGTEDIEGKSTDE